jgi:membrane protease YdiL (CAAX protease family)
MKIYISKWTITGLLIAFAGTTLLLLVFDQFVSGKLTNIEVIIRELSIFSLAGVLIWIIFAGEKSNLSSIGLNNNHWGKSLLLSLFLVVVCYVVVFACLGIFKLVGISFGGGGGDRYDNISPWVMTLVMLRAGVVEELFYRGYIIERLEKLSSSKLVFLLFPAVIFGLLHFKQGIGGIIMAFSMGLVISYFYWKKRDLKANIIAHFLVDFIPNVLLPLIGGE